MELWKAKQIAEKVKSELSSYCERIEIAGSIRRQKPNVKDIEIVAIPKPYDIGMFETGIAQIVNKWKKVKGELPCKYTQRVLPEGIKLDLFFTEPENWGLIYTIRTGSAEFSHQVLAVNWVKAGYKSIEGNLYRMEDMKKIAIPEESDLFKLIGVKYVEPHLRVVR